jgi:MFS family permease
VQLLNKLAVPPAAAQHATSRVRAAATAFFAFDGFIFATWAVRIPAVKAATGASPAELGIALLGVSGGAILTMALSGVLCRRFGAVRVLICGAGWLSLALLLPALARSALALGLGLVVFGIGYGCVNVAANTVAVDVVAVLRRPVMPSFHAAWSLGGLTGAALGGLLAPHLAPLPQFAIATVLGLAVTIAAGRVLLTTTLPGQDALPDHEVPTAVSAEIGPETLESAVAGHGAGSGSAGTGPRGAGAGSGTAGAGPETVGAGLGTARPGTAGVGGRAHLWRMVLLLGVLAACSTYGEGSVTDWGALRLHGLGAGAGLAAIGYAAFALAEACGRLAGSWLLARFGQRTVLVSGGIVTCAGMLCAALAPSIPVVVAGFALAGLGVANAFPAAMTRVGLLAGPHGVAIASTLGYGGFLLGPPAIGFLAGAIGLGPALTTVSVLAVVAVLIALFVTPGAGRENQPATPSHDARPAGA